LVCSLYKRHFHSATKVIQIMQMCVLLRILIRSTRLSSRIFSLAPDFRKQHTATSDYQGRIWMWGGVR
jgi:hypothetical protein